MGRALPKEACGETAAAAGVRLALVRWGFGGAEELAPFDAWLRPATPRELTAALAGGITPPGSR